MVLRVLIRTIEVFVVGSVLYLSVSKGVTLFSWHPLLMSVGFVVLLTEALGIFTSKTYLGQEVKYSDKVTLHWGLNASAATLIGIAFWSIYTNKNNNDFAHFISPHATYGLITLIMVAGTSSGGLAAKYNALFCNFIKPVQLKLVHSLFGTLTYIMATYTLCLGLQSDWTHKQISEQWINVLVYATWSMAGLALINPLGSILSKIRTLF